MNSGAEQATIAPERGLAHDLGRRPHLDGQTLVRRERITSRCSAGHGASVVLLAAPAGYGKTSALHQWADVDTRPFAWVTLDDRHNDPAVLVHSVAAALDEIEPLGESVFAPLLVPSPSLWNALIPRLSEALRERPATSRSGSRRDRGFWSTRRRSRATPRPSSTSSPAARSRPTKARSSS